MPIDPDFWHLPIQKPSRLSTEELGQIEETLRKNLAKTREKYLEASKRYKELLTLTADLGLDHPDGRLSLQAAVKSQRHAISVYARALRNFNDFILNGRLPESTEADPED